jgi:hypothetical protein
MDREAKNLVNFGRYTKVLWASGEGFKTNFIEILKSHFEG